MSAHNFSAYVYTALPGPVAGTSAFQGLLLVPNSSDIAAANSTLKPLFDYMESEKQAGRQMEGSIQGVVLPSFFDVWGPLENWDTNGGKVQIMGSRLCPLSIFQEGNYDALLNLLVETPLSPMFNLGTS
jgi:hypothetical protein